MSKPSLILFDTETSGGRGLADILTIDALFFDYNFKKLDEFSCMARMRKSRVYEVDSFLVNGLDPFELDKCSNSNFDLTKKTNEKDEKEKLFMVLLEFSRFFIFLLQLCSPGLAWPALVLGLSGRTGRTART